MNIKEIANQFSNKHILGVGESTHGTHEFFMFKAEISIEMIVYHGFNTVMLEDRIGVCKALNEWIYKGTGDLDILLKKLYKVWQIKEIKDFIIWLKHNRNKYPVNFVGFDIVQTQKNINQREALMAKNISNYMHKHQDAKSIVWAHNYHVKYSSPYQGRQMGSYLREEFGREYSAVALFFGTGTLCATLMSDSTDYTADRTLDKILVKDLPNDFLEAKLPKNKNEFPTYLRASDVDVFSKKSKARSVGWGAVQKNINDYIDFHIISREFDGVVYYDTAEASRPLTS